MQNLLKTTALGLALFLIPATAAQAVTPAQMLTHQSSAMTLDDQRGVLTMAPLLEKVTPAVVSISTEGTQRRTTDNPQMEEFFERFFGESPQSSRRSGSIGSGVIVDAANGYIMTNNHVVKDADEITVTLKDKREFSAELVGGDPRTDIAILQIEANGLREMRLAPFNQTKVGDYVIAIGNAFGLAETVTTGIVSGLGRSLNASDQLQDMIQTDASINPGNSGGALINSKGELIGINTMILSRSGGNNGIGFAVPVRMAKSVMDQLVSTGEVQRGRIGVSIRDIDPALKEALGLSTLNGALVNDVNADSPAEKAGLESGDIIIGFNGDEINNANDIRNAVGLVTPGTRSDLSYLRDGRRRTTRIMVEAFTDNESGENKKLIDTKASEKETFSGAELANIPSDMELQDGNDGVLVTRVEGGSKAQRAGLLRGDIIRAVGRKPVSSLDEFQKAVEDRTGPIALTVERNGTNLFLAIR